MKYKFIARFIAEEKFNLSKDSKDADIIKELLSPDNLYAEGCNLYYRYKDWCRETNTSSGEERFIEQFLDYIVLGGYLTCKDVQLIAKKLRPLLDNLTIHQVKTVHKFRLFIEKVGAENGSQSQIEYLESTVEDSKTLIDKEADILYYAVKINLIIVGLFALELGVLYMRTPVRNSFLSLGKELDKLFNLGNAKSPIVDYEAGFELLKNDAKAKRPDINFDGYNPPKEERVKMVNNLIADFLKMQSSSFCFYSLNLVELMIALHDKYIRSIIENYVNSDILKYSPENQMFLLEHVTHSFTLRYVPEKEFYDKLYTRKALIPTSGVCLVSEEGKAKLIVVEYDDELLGHGLFSLALDSVDNSFFNANSIYLTLKCSTVQVITPYALPFYSLLGVYEVGSKVRFTNIGVESTNENGITKVSKSYAVNTVKNTEYKIYLPTYWNSTKNTAAHTNKANSKVSILGEEIKHISPFKRKLAKGHTRSQEAESNAKRLCIKLEDNETIVTGFDRKQKVKL